MKIDLLDIDAYKDGPPFEQLDWLRENHPVYWHPEPNGPGFWAVTRHQDVKRIENDWATYSSAVSVTYSDDTNSGDGQHFQLLMSDPPRHDLHRDFMSKELRPAAVKAWGNHVDEIARQVIDDVIERGECDLVEDIAGKLASYVIADLLGLSREDSLDLFWAANISVQGASKEFGDGLKAKQIVFAHAARAWEDRQANPGTDMLSRLAHGEVDGVPVDQMQFSIDFLLLVFAGEDTTRNAFSGGLLALMDNPEQRRKLIDDPDLIPSAVEEMLRWTTPLIYQRRTATKDTELGGHAIRKGDKVVHYYISANRDESVFTDPYTFDVTRSPNPHLSFGLGRHFCLGVHLARRELVAILGEVLRRMPDIEQVGPAVQNPYVVAPAVCGLSEVKVRFTPGPRLGVDVDEAMAH